MHPKPKKTPTSLHTNIRPCHCLKYPHGHADTRSHYKHAACAHYWQATADVHMPLCMRARQVVGEWCYHPVDNEKAIVEFVRGLSDVELSWLIKTKKDSGEVVPMGLVLFCGKQLLFPSKGHLELK